MKWFRTVFVVLLSLPVWVNIAGAQDMRVTLLGTGTPILNINRFGMSTLVEAGGQALLFDAGRGVAMRLHQRKMPLRDLAAIFITHLHSDHITGLADLYATAPLPTDDGRRTEPVEIWGPAGIESVARGVELTFTENNRIRLIGKELVEPATKIITHEIAVEGGVVYAKNGVRVTAFAVDHGHAKPAFGYRVDDGSHSVVLSGDTTYTPNLITHARGADLLVHCVAIASRRLENAAPDYVQHFYEYLASPEMVGRILNEVRPRAAVFSHISLYSRAAIPRATEDELLSRVRAIYDGPLVIGQDLMSFSIGSNGVVAEPYTPAVRQQEPD